MNTLLISGIEKITFVSSQIISSNNRRKTEIYKIQKATELSKLSIEKDYQKDEKMYNLYLNCARATLSSGLSNANKTKAVEKIIDKINCI